MNQTTQQSDDESSCSELIACYGEYADGMLDATTAARLRRHLEACASCARYDRIICRGAELARDFLAVEPSPDFEQRLQHRIFHEQDTAALHSARPAAVPTALAIAAMIALLAWSPLLLSNDAPSMSSATTAMMSSASMAGGAATVAGVAGGVSVARLGGGAPFAGRTAWYRVPATSSSAMFVAFPGPHSPLIVTPPAHRRARTVSAEYSPVE